MLVPVGIAYAVASGVPGIYGLYATIVPLLAYALFGPSRILVLGPDSSLAAVILAVVLPLSGGDPLRAVALAGMMAVVSGMVCIAGRRGAPGLRHRAAFQADPLRLHERHRADGIDQPAAQAVRLLDRERRTAAGPVGHRHGGAGRQDQLDRVHGRRRHPGGDPAAQGQQARAGHPDRRGRRDRRRRRAGPGGARRRVGARLPPARPARVRHPVDHLRRYRPGPDRRLRRRPRLVRRHQRALARLCGADRAPMSTRTRRWWGSAPPTWPPDSFRAFRSAAVRHARPWPRPRAPEPS